MLFQVSAHENYCKGVSFIVYSKDGIIVSITILNEVRISDYITKLEKIKFSALSFMWSLSFITSQQDVENILYD